MANRKTTSSSDPRVTRSDRAQPGDVIGIERDGKRTHVGDSAEDENEELEEALEDAEEADAEDLDRDSD